MPWRHLWHSPARRLRSKGLPQSCEVAFSDGAGNMQETLEEGCKKIDDIVESFGDVGLKDRSMVWNTDLVEVRAGTQLLISTSLVSEL